MRCSHAQVFAAEDPETTTDEDEAMPEMQQGAPADDQSRIYRLTAVVQTGLPTIGA